MTSPHELIQSHARSLALAIICLAHLWTPAWGQNTFPNTGNAGIGTTTPLTGLHVATAPDGVDRMMLVQGTADAEVWLAPAGSSMHTGIKLFGTADILTNTERLFVGYHENRYGTYEIGSEKTGSGNLRPLMLSMGGTAAVFLDTSGRLGIGTTNPQHMLHVAGTIGAEEVIVSSTGADYVFKPGYQLAGLKQVSAYIQQNRHLPGIPSETEVKEKGVSLGEMQSKLLAKVEELTLHMIQAEERNDHLERQNKELQERIDRIEAQAATR